MGLMILKFTEKHPVISMLVISALLMWVVNDEALSFGIAAIWGILGIGYFFKQIDKERSKW